MTRAIRGIIGDHPALAASFGLYYMLLIGYGLRVGSGQWPTYALLMPVLAGIVIRLYATAPLSALVLWGLALWGFAHMVGGLVLVGDDVVYERTLGAGELRFDKIVHFFGFGFATLAAYEIVRQKVGHHARASAVASTAVFVGLGAGAVNETIEFLITLLPGESNVGGFSNTGWDLVANTAGAALAGVLAPVLERGRARGGAPGAAGDPHVPALRASRSEEPRA